jgi:hypothetical protein
MVKERCLRSFFTQKNCIMKRYLILGLLLVAVIGGTVAYLMYNKPHQNMTRATPDFELTATELFSEFDTGEEEANAEYLDKIIAVSGTVTEAKTDESGQVSVTLDSGNMMFGVICQLDEHTPHKRTDFEEGEEVTFKCICTGMLMDVVLVRCVEVPMIE